MGAILDRALGRFARTVATSDTGGLKLRVGIITAVTPGAAADGNDAVTVDVNGNSVPAPYLASYTPVVDPDNLVAVLLIGNSPLILGQIIGLPDF